MEPTQLHLKDREAWTIVEPIQLKIDLCKPVLDSRHFFLPLFMSAIAGQPRLFVCTSLIGFQSPTLCKRGTTLYGQLTVTPTSIDCKAPNMNLENIVIKKMPYFIVVANVERKLLKMTENNWETWRHAGVAGFDFSVLLVLRDGSREFEERTGARRHKEHSVWHLFIVLCQRYLSIWWFTVTDLLLSMRCPTTQCSSRGGWGGGGGDVLTRWKVLRVNFLDDLLILKNEIFASKSKKEFFPIKMS